MLPRDLRMVFFPIEQTLGHPKYPLTQDPYTFRSFDFRRFGLQDLTVASIENLMKTLKGDHELMMKYLVMKRGYDPEDPEEFKKAISLYFKTK